MRIEDVASRLGISKSTVSLAINNKPGISEDTRKKVLETIESLGYVPRKIVKADSKNDNTIKFLTCIDTESFIPSHYNISSSFFTELIHGIEKECDKNSYTLSFSTIPLNNFEEHLCKVKESNSFNAAILLGTSLSAAQIKFVASQIPNLVVLDTLYDYLDVDFIVMNNSMGGYKACSYLIELGHKNIGYAQSKTRIVNFDLRKRGFLNALEENNIVLSNTNRFVVENETNTAKNMFKELISTRKDPLPTAIFCESDYIAIGIIKALDELGIGVPRDISIIGFDDVPEGIIISPELSTIRVDRNKIGSLAVKRLISLIRKKKDAPSIKQVIDTFLVERRSCIRINGSF